MNRHSHIADGASDELRLDAMSQVFVELVSSQRELVACLTISIGNSNLVPGAPRDRGLVKVENFRRNDPEMGDLYPSTPSGVTEKARFTRTFISRREINRAQLQFQIATLKAALKPGSAGAVDVHLTPPKWQ